MGVLSEYIAKKVFPECKKLKYINCKQNKTKEFKWTLMKD
jgi:hypothetical protein